MADKGTAKKRIFNLDTFEKETKEVTYDLPEPLTSKEQLAGLDEKVLLQFVNSGMERQAWKDARASISGASPKMVNDTVNAFRGYMFTDVIEKDAQGEVTPESRKKQTQAIYAFIRSNESILNGLKAAAERAAANENDEEDQEDEEK